MINIITKGGEDLPSAQVTGRGWAVRNYLGSGGTATLAHADGDNQFVLSASYDNIDRSGLALPGSSPAGSFASGGTSSNDIARPKSLFGKLTLAAVPGGELSMLASIQNLDSHGAFQTFGPLSPITRIDLLNQDYRLSYVLTPHEKWSGNVSAYYFSGAPTGDSVDDVNDPTVNYRPVVGSSGFGVSEEFQWRPLPRLALVEGIDYLYDQEALQTYDQVALVDVQGAGGALLRRAGTVTPGQSHGAQKLFQNLGGYLQLRLRLFEALSLTGGARLDDHSIYGLYPSGRAAIVFAPPDQPYSFKLLYGESFKAPSPVQLYSQALTTNDVIGNPLLQPQTAHTEELALSYKLPAGRGEVTVNGYLTELSGLVTFSQDRLFLQATNSANAVVVGGELDSRISLARPLHLRFSAGYAKTVSQQDLLGGTVAATQPLFPDVQLHVLLDYVFPWLGLRFAPEISYIGARDASQSNTLIQGTLYSLSPYVYLAGSLTATPEIFAKHPTQFTLRVSDILGSSWAEPGFNGIDIPTQGRTVLLMITQPM